MNFLLAITDSYAPYCGVTIKSIIENNRDLDLNFYIVCPDISEKNRKLMGVKDDGTKEREKACLFAGNPGKVRKMR